MKKEDYVVYFGWACLALAMVVGWRARVAFQAYGQAEEPGDWLHTRVVVDRGIYGLVRHPMYLSFMLISLGLVLLSGHWLNLALGVVLMGLLYNDMCREERSNLDKFGEAYERYMQRVPHFGITEKGGSHGSTRALEAQKAAAYGLQRSIAVRVWYSARSFAASRMRRPSRTNHNAFAIYYYISTNSTNRDR